MHSAPLEAIRRRCQIFAQVVVGSGADLTGCGSSSGEALSVSVDRDAEHPLHCGAFEARAERRQLKVAPRASRHRSPRWAALSSCARCGGNWPEGTAALRFAALHSFPIGAIHRDHLGARQRHALKARSTGATSRRCSGMAR